MGYRVYHLQLTWSNPTVLWPLCCLYGLSPAPNSSYKSCCQPPLAQEGAVMEAELFTLSLSEYFQGRVLAHYL